MTRGQWQLPEIDVDGFCGAGGASFGIRSALGKDPDLALNHSQLAIAQHWLNFRNSHHLLQDVWKVDPRSACAGRRVGLLWASPACTHFSRAKAGKPLDRKIRELPWSIVRWAKTVAPRVICVEEVEEFEDWCPLLEDGTPDPERRGESFQRWVRALRRNGYDKVEWKRIVAADHGAPTTRRRLFVVARRDGLPIVWPTATHGPGRQPYRTMLECVDWSIPGKAVYGRLKPKTIKRIEDGIDLFVRGMHGPEHVHRTDDGRLLAAFIAQHNGGQIGKPLSVPLPTITTRDRHGLVTVELVEDRNGEIRFNGRRYRLGPVAHRMLEPPELALAMAFPRDLQMLGTKTEQGKSIGNAVSPVVAQALVTSNYEPQGLRIAA